MKIVINVTYGGFRLSKEAVKYLSTLTGQEEDTYSFSNDRSNPHLVKTVETIPHKDLKIVEIPDHVKWHIAEYDGKEWVAEDHRTWN